LPAVHFVLLQYSSSVADFIAEKGHDLHAQNDFAFMTNVFETIANLF
jgi:hypothetical protein